MRSEVPQVIWHTCRFVIFCWKLRWAVKNYGRIAIKFSSADDRVQLRRSRYEDGSRPTGSRHVERRRWSEEKLKDTFIMHTSWKILISFSWREYDTRERWVLRECIFSWTRSIHYADGYESFLIKLMYRFLVLELKDRELFISIRVLRW